MARENQGKIKRDIELPEDRDIFEDVSEDEYNKVVQERKEQGAAFIEDDDNLGYMDDGEENWDDYNYDELDEMEQDIKRNATSSAHLMNAHKIAQAKKAKISSTFLTHRRARVDPTGQSLASKVTNTRSEIPEDFLEAQLKDLDANPLNPTSRAKLLSNEEIALFGRNDDVSKAHYDVERQIYEKQLEMPIEPAADIDYNIDVDVAMDDALVEPQSYVSDLPEESIPIKVTKLLRPDVAASRSIESKPQPTIAPVMVAPPTTKSEETTVSAPPTAPRTEEPQIKRAKLSEIPSSSMTTATAPTPPVVDVHSSQLSFFWLDAYYDQTVPGSIFLIGRNHTSSICLRVNNIQKNLFLVPKEGYTLVDVYSEFSNLAASLKITSFKSKKVERSHAFDNCFEQLEVLKVVYSDSYPAPPEHEYTSFKVFTNNVLESFILKRGLSGPSWLEVDDVSIVYSKQSWCGLEYTVDDPKKIQVSTVKQASPLLGLISLDVTLTNNNTEVLAISWVSTKTNIDTPGDSGLERFTYVRSDGAPWPYDPQMNEIPMRVCSSERELLNFFLTSIRRMDPDILLSHGNVIDILFKRISDFKLQNWSILGRLQKSKAPQKLNAYTRNSICSGRLIIDTNVCSREFVYSADYSLSYLVGTRLNERLEVVPNDALSKLLTTSNGIRTFVDYTVRNALLTYNLMQELTILQLTRQLTNLAGNLWNSSLRASRSDRIDYLLLHEFYKKKYILPLKKYVEKSDSKEKGYEGGLVLEPVKGFYDTIILLLDFNSLYPSIIQEYDICFSTVPYWNTDETGSLCNLPEQVKEPKGILPNVLRQLVARRRAVKDLIKTSSGVELTQLEIRQKALKLVANSMYGCLGFSSSRFYCRSLAAATTSLGRMTLGNTVNLVESQGYSVIYGDTDSVMVNSRTFDVTEAKRIAATIRSSVNKLYSKLEIDLDRIFKQILLIKKKKYAGTVVIEKDGHITLKEEIKGLDLVRRDWCNLSKDIGMFVLSEILSERRGQLVENIQNALVNLATSMRSGLVSVDKYVITKSLNKPIGSYGSLNAPHVKVASDMVKNGRQVNVGDMIPYVVMEGDGNVVDRSVHPYMFKDVNIDVEWYLRHQILVPISRMCEVIDGVQNDMLEVSLGLEPTHRSKGEIQDAERILLNEYDKELEVNCPGCGTPSSFKGMLAWEDMKGFKCASEGCVGLLKGISNILVSQVFKAQSEFYNRISSCDEPSCDIHISGTRFLDSKCSCGGSRVEKKAPYDLYSHLRFLAALVDVDRAKDCAKLSDRTLIMNPHNEALLRKTHGMVQRVLNKSKMHWIDPGIFSSTRQ